MSWNQDWPGNSWKLSVSVEFPTAKNAGLGSSFWGSHLGGLGGCSGGTSWYVGQGWHISAKLRLRSFSLWQLLISSQDHFGSKALTYSTLCKEKSVLSLLWSDQEQTSVKKFNWTATQKDRQLSGPPPTQLTNCPDQRRQKDREQGGRP